MILIKKMKKFKERSVSTAAATICNVYIYKIVYITVL